MQTTSPRRPQLERLHFRPMLYGAGGTTPMIQMQQSWPLGFALEPCLVLTSTSNGRASRRVAGKLVHTKRIAACLTLVVALLEGEHGEMRRSFSPVLEDQGSEIITDACPWALVVLCITARNHRGGLHHTCRRSFCKSFKQVPATLPTTHCGKPLHSWWRCDCGCRRRTASSVSASRATMLELYGRC